MFKSLDTATIRREIAGEVKARTSAYADKFGYGRAEAAPEKPRKSEKATKLDELLATEVFGCNSSSVAKALSIVMGEELTYNAQRSNAYPRVEHAVGVAVVTIDAKLGFTPTWGFDKTVVQSMNGYFADATGKVGAMSGKKANSRPATAKEIDTLVAALPDKAILSLAVSILASEPVPAEQSAR